MGTKSFYGSGQGSFYGGGLYGNGQSSVDFIEKTIGPASIASFNDGLKNKPLKECIIDIEPVQDLHGYDAPWPAGGGANLLPPITGSTANGVTLSANNGVYTLTGTASARTDFDVDIDIAAGQYYMSMFNAAVNSAVTIFLITQSGTNNPFATATATNYGVSVNLAEKAVKFRIRVNNGTTFASGFVLKPILAKGSTAPTSWTPYSNICPITGWTGAKVTRCGFNVLDEEFEVGYINTTTGENSPSPSNALRSKNYISVRPNTTYYYCNGTNGDSNPFFYDANKNFIGRLGAYLNNQTFVIPDNAYYMRLNLKDAYGTTYNNDISINYPATDHDYHAYAGQVYDISWQTQAGTVYGGSLDVTNGILTVNRAMVDMGTLTWAESSILPASGGKAFYTPLSDIGMKAREPHTPNTMYSSIYVPASSEAWSVIDMLPNQIFNNRANLFVNAQYEDATLFTSAMNKVQLCYQLATPVTYQLTPVEVSTLLGTNNIWADTGDTTVTYLANK